MITQKDTLKAEIKLLETQLQHAALFQDAFSQIQLYKELEVKKTTINGMYKVSFDRTTGIISRIMDTVYNKKPLSFIDEYPSIINGLQLNDINEAIKKYYTKDKCITIVSGSVK